MLKVWEVMGGNGILFEYDVVCFVVDVEVIYFYEGMKEINMLIVGCVIIGKSVFVWKLIIMIKKVGWF